LIFIESFGQVLKPLGFVQSELERHPTQAPIDPLYLIPTFFMTLFSKTRDPSTYFSSAGAEAILSRLSYDR